METIGRACKAPAIHRRIENDDQFAAFHTSRTSDQKRNSRQQYPACWKDYAIRGIIKVYSVCSSAYACAPSLVESTKSTNTTIT